MMYSCIYRSEWYNEWNGEWYNDTYKNDYSQYSWCSPETDMMKFVSDNPNDETPPYFEWDGPKSFWEYDNLYGLKAIVYPNIIEGSIDINENFTQYDYCERFYYLKVKSDIYPWYEFHPCCFPLNEITFGEIIGHKREL